MPYLSHINLPLLSIPAYFVFSLLPHYYAHRILYANGYNFDRANPKASTSPEVVKDKVPGAVFQRYQRAEKAQANNHEQTPLYAAAVIASLLADRVGVKGVVGINVVAGLESTSALDLDTFVRRWFLVRILYNVAYICIDRHAVSFVRSLLWASGSCLVGWQIWKAACVLG